MNSKCEGVYTVLQYVRMIKWNTFSMASLDLLAMLQFADIQGKSSYVMIFAAMRACATGGV